MAISADSIKRLLLDKIHFDGEDLDFAKELHQAGIVKIAQIDNLPKEAIAYRVRTGKANRDCLDTSPCPLFDGTFSKHNGVILENGANNLKCSNPSCSYRTCPYGLAACFSLVSSHSENAADKLKEDFHKKWNDRIVDDNKSLDLLLSPKENDYIGAIVVEDDFALGGFLIDITAALEKRGKIEKGGFEARSLIELKTEPNSAKFADTKSRNLKPRRLYVFNRIGDFLHFYKTSKPDDAHTRFQFRFTLERLGKIVDERYYLFVGTREEIRELIQLNAVFDYTLAKHIIVLKGMSHEEILESYKGKLDEGIAAEIDADFQRDFLEFVHLNEPLLPFSGEELADYLAKESNRLGRLCRPQSSLESRSAEEMLGDIIGLGKVKEAILRMERGVAFNKRMSHHGCKPPSSNMNMLFLGNPGTGKTYVAEKISALLCRIGVIPTNKCVQISGSDLIGQYVGTTSLKARETIGRAIGGVLIVDEAYVLAGFGGTKSDFGQEAIAELLLAMEEHKNDLVVIFAGYEKAMQDFVSKNQGIASRIGFTFHFEDYSPDELCDIFLLGLSKSGYKAAEDIRGGLLPLFKHFSRYGDFGNGRFANNVLAKAIQKHAENFDFEENYDIEAAKTISAADVPSIREMMDETGSEGVSAEELLEPIVGMDGVKEKIRDLEQVSLFKEDARRKGIDLPGFSNHMIFLGNPGTGKTTIARIIGKLLHNIGTVPSTVFIEVEAKDFVSGAEGSPSKTTEKILERAMGGVLFVDEAYALYGNPSGPEVIAQLVKAMEDRKEDIVIIFAGYEDEMRRFLDINPGLASRIGYSFNFEDYSPEELLAIFERKVKESGLILWGNTAKRAEKIFKYFHKVENFGNGRFVDKVFQETIAKSARANSGRAEKAIKPSYLPTIEELCKLTAVAVSEPADSDQDAIRRIAIHEIGHALCFLHSNGTSDIVSITVEQEGNGALGYVQHKSSTANPTPTSSNYRDIIMVKCGGMAAEQVCFGNYSSGNSSDLRSATWFATRYVATYGMSDAGLVQYVPVRTHLFDRAEEVLCKLPEPVRNEIDSLLKEEFERAQEVIRGNQAIFDEMVDLLLDKKTIKGKQLDRIWKKRTTA